MKILLAGSNGFIGKNFFHKLKNEHDLTLFEWGETWPGVDGMDMVIHLGAISSTAYKDVNQIMLQNYEFTVDLMEECSAKDVPLQIASSASVYGPENTTFREDDTPDPRTPYAWSKYLAERYWQTHKLKNRVQFFRYFNIYGQYEDHKGDQASPYTKFAKQLEAGKKVKLFEGSDQIYRDFLAVEFVMLQHKQFWDINESGIWNCGSGEPKSFLEVAKSLGVEDNQIEWCPIPKELLAGYQRFTKADNTKFLRTLGHA